MRAPRLVALVVQLTSVVSPFLFVALVLAAQPASASSILIHSYSFSGDASDQVGTADGSLVGGATATSGYLALDGSSGYVQFASHIVPTAGDYTVALFAQELSAVGSYIELISQGYSGGPGYYLGHDPGGIIRASDQWLNTGVPFPSDSLWHHYALVVDATGGTTKLYIDGLLQSTLAGGLIAGAGGTDTRLGRQFDPYTEFFHGNLDDLQIYQGALTSEEVAAIATRSVVPEPGTFILMAGGLFALAGRRIRSRGRSSRHR